MKLLIFFIKKTLKTLIYTMCLLQLTPGLAADSSKGAHKRIKKQLIEQQAVDYVQSLFPEPELGKLSYKAISLDRRIKIKPCDSPLKLSIPGTSSLSKRTTVQVRCTSEKSWSLYVQVKITKLVPVVVARVNLPPGMVISHDNVAVMLKDTNQVRGRILGASTLLIGAKTSRHIFAGQPVTLRQVCLVCKGDNVVIIAKSKGLQVKTSGISQQNGSLGDNIAILNTRSNKRVSAKVVAVNNVEVYF
jgi:flagella basal body P-ring formation protein FlgA